MFKWLKRKTKIIVFVNDEKGNPIPKIFTVTKRFARGFAKAIEEERERNKKENKNEN